MFSSLEGRRVMLRMVVGRMMRKVMVKRLRWLNVYLDPERWLRKAKR